MGRRKIEIEQIQDQRTRKVTFSKRRIGVFKKAYELAILCNIDIAIIIIDKNKPENITSNEKVYQFSSKNNIKRIINTFQNSSNIINEYKKIASLQNDSDNNEEEEEHEPEEDDNDNALINNDQNNNNESDVETPLNGNNKRITRNSTPISNHQLKRQKKQKNSLFQSPSYKDMKSRSNSTNSPHTQNSPLSSSDSNLTTQNNLEERSSRTRTRSRSSKSMSSQPSASTNNIIVNNNSHNTNNLNNYSHHSQRPTLSLTIPQNSKPLNSADSSRTISALDTNKPINIPNQQYQSQQQIKTDSSPKSTPISTTGTSLTSPNLLFPLPIPQISPTQTSTQSNIFHMQNNNNGGNSSALTAAANNQLHSNNIINNNNNNSNNNNVIASMNNSINNASLAQVQAHAQAQANARLPMLSTPSSFSLPFSTLSRSFPNLQGSTTNPLNGDQTPLGGGLPSRYMTMDFPSPNSYYSSQEWSNININNYLNVSQSGITPLINPNSHALSSLNTSSSSTSAIPANTGQMQQLQQLQSPQTFFNPPQNNNSNSNNNNNSNRYSSKKR